MATFDYRNEASGEILEIIRMPGEPAPKEFERDGERWVRLPAAPRIVTQDTRKFRNPPSPAWLKANDKRIVEAGHTKDVARAQKYKTDKQDAVLEETVVAAVNRAMP